MLEKKGARAALLGGGNLAQGNRTRGDGKESVPAWLLLRPRVFSMAAFSFCSSAGQKLDLLSGLPSAMENFQKINALFD